MNVVQTQTIALTQDWQQYRPNQQTKSVTVFSLGWCEVTESPAGADRTWRLPLQKEVSIDLQTSDTLYLKGIGQAVITEYDAPQEGLPDNTISGDLIVERIAESGSWPDVHFTADSTGYLYLDYSAISNPVGRLGWIELENETTGEREKIVLLCERGSVQDGCTDTRVYFPVVPGEYHLTMGAGTFHPQQSGGDHNASGYAYADVRMPGGDLWQLEQISLLAVFTKTKPEIVRRSMMWPDNWRTLEADYETLSTNLRYRFYTRGLTSLRGVVFCALTDIGGGDSPTVLINALSWQIGSWPLGGQEGMVPADPQFFEFNLAPFGDAVEIALIPYLGDAWGVVLSGTE